MTETVKRIKPKRISDVQAKKSARAANPKRQYGSGAVGRFVTHASSLVDLYALYVEKSMDVAPGKGRGCRVQTYHLDIAFAKMQSLMNELILESVLNEYEQDLPSDDE